MDAPLPQGRFGERAARANRHFAIRRQIRPNRPAYPGRISIGSIKGLPLPLETRLTPIQEERWSAAGFEPKNAGETTS